MVLNPINQQWCAVDYSNRHASYYWLNHTFNEVCYHDWDGDGYLEYWDDEHFQVHAQLDWGLEEYSTLPSWIGGDEVSQLPLYVRGLEPGIQYRVVLYFDLVSVTHYTE